MSSKTRSGVNNISIMRSPCRKLTWTFMWCILECLFFAGYLNGWFWMQDVLNEEGYFIHTCNISFSGHHVIKRPVTMIHNGQKVKCMYEKVTKVISLDEYARLHKENKIGNKATLSAKDKSSSNNQQMCPQQRNTSEFVYLIVHIVRNILLLPLGIIYDIYGTTRARILALCCTAFGSLTMLFSSNTYPWLILPALLMLGLSGFLILLTDLQVSNLFGPRRYTVMSVFVGAYFSGGIVIFFMKLTKATGVSLQTSFMFTTIGIVPVLISTIAMLPKSRIPWPLPAEYEKNGRVNYSEDKHGKAKAWQRRTSDDTKKKGDLTEFWDTIKTKMFIFCAIWFSLLNLKIWLFDATLHVQLKHLGVSDISEYQSIYGVILLLSLPMSPLIGLVMDWKKSQASTQHHVAQMRNILNAIGVHLCIAILSSVTSLFTNTYLQVISFIFVTMEKVTLHATLFAFLTHVHFPGEHLGKLVGVIISVSGITLILQFPLKMLVHYGKSENTFYVHIVLLAMVLLSGCHPLSVWYHCRTGGIKHRGEILENDRPLTVVLLENLQKRKEKRDTEVIENDSNKHDSETTKLQITDL